MNKLGLVTGSLGIGVCYYYSWLLTHDDFFLNAFTKTVYSSLKNSKSGSSLGSGLASLFWLNGLCPETKLLSNTQSDKLAISLCDYMLRMLDCGNYSLFKGACGICLGFLQMKDNSQSRAISAFVDKTESFLQKDDAFQEKRKNGDRIDTVTFIGCPHGITGLLLLCLRIRESSHLVTDGLLISIARRLLGFCHDDMGSKHFPHSITGQSTIEREFLPWVCWSYGDLMSSYAFLKLGILLDNPEYTRFGHSLLLSTIDRKDCFNKYDLGLCCGLSSIPIVYNAAYLLTNEDVFLNASRTWKEDMDNLFFDKWNGLGDSLKNQEIKNPSLYYGVPGAILTDLLFACGVSDWTSALLL